MMNVEIASEMFVVDWIPKMMCECLLCLLDAPTCTRCNSQYQYRKEFAMSAVDEKSKVYKMSFAF